MTYVATHPVQNSPLLKLLDNWEMESPEPVRRLRKNEGVTSVPVEFWTCSRVEVRQYSLVLIVSSGGWKKYNEVHSRLVSRTSPCDHLVVVVKD